MAGKLMGYGTLTDEIAQSTERKKMTREEAIEMLKSKMDGNTDTSYEWAETVRMAIKALEQEPCEDRMVTILTEIQTKIESVPKYSMTHDGICVYRKADEYIADVNKVIQQKIDALKMESEDKE